MTELSTNTTRTTDHFTVDGEITELVLAGPEVPDFAFHEEEALDGARNLFCRRLKVILTRMVDFCFRPAAVAESAVERDTVLRPSLPVGYLFP